MMEKPIHIRNLDKEDLKSIVDIEERVTGVARPDYWEKRIEIAEAIRPHWASLVAETDNRVTGFILGRAGELEQKIGRALIEKFTQSAEDHGIKSIFTLVDHGNLEIERFFNRLGFIQGKMLHFQKTIT
jgi:ribosomal protein S18 acetylase RimI-like enzyme